MKMARMRPKIAVLNCADGMLEDSQLRNRANSDRVEDNDRERYKIYEPRLSVLCVDLQT